MTSILLVEDSPTQAQELAFMLEDAGFKVETAPDARRAWDLLSRGTFDLVLTDLFLPGDSGIDLCKRIKTSQFRRLPVILVTRSANPVHLLRGLESGADDFMTKDNEPVEIAGRILRALSRPRLGESKTETARQVSFRGEEFELETDRECLLNVLLSAFEDLLRASESNKLELTRRMQAEDELRRAHSGLERKVQERTAELGRVNHDLAQKNQENELFVYSVSHDLRSPLVNLQGFSKELGALSKELRGLLLEAGVPATVRDRGVALIDGDVDEALRFIQAGVMRLSGIIDALLKLSRAGRREFHWQVQDVNAIVDRIVASVHSTIEERGATVTRQDLRPVWGDATSLEQILSNLIGNALNYLSPQRPGRIEVGMAEQSTQECFTYYVKDNGLGIPEAYQGKIFQAFQRLRPEVAVGEGIGLTIVSRIVERYRGRLWVESKVNEGSTFYLSLPATESAGSSD